jgi:hypothetical protein
VIADCVPFPVCGCTFNGPLQAVPGLPVVHCAQETPDSTISKPTNKQFFISSPDV